jgi:hypothetical protein
MTDCTYSISVGPTGFTVMDLTTTPPELVTTSDAIVDLQRAIEECIKRGTGKDVFVWIANKKQEDSMTPICDDRTEEPAKETP